ncbi:hypothetical protein GS397_00825 [Sphingobium yanoikuyae]|uniref:DUF7689 domain-containing protein n=1 Tax=Sphingobium yanoikuyae TaxID=13690 RepID=A0A6P1GC27_SPHYA|nr:hypothetical protein [Sphingobium yanoikuyae]QHD65754.1 hypothetical protein GS397_00825 [Sphingobium yanoikuyae]
MLGAEFPHATAGNIKPTSEATHDYNCIAWALHVNDRFIWPDEDEQFAWPPMVAREETLAAFTELFTLSGFERCINDQPEPGYEKVALYGRDGAILHAARLLPSGKWASKLGVSIDIEHSCPVAISGGEYGWVVAVFRRPAKGRPALPPLHPVPAPPPLLIGIK